MLSVFHSPPFALAWTVVAEGQLPLPYHSTSVDLALILVAQPIGGPATGSQAIELDPGFPGVADTAPPQALDLAAVVGRTVFRGTKDQVGLAVEEDVAAVVAILPDVLR